MASRASAIFTLASVTVLGGLVAYAVYFDFKRRNDTEFRKRLRKDKKRVNKQAAQTQESSNASLGISVEELKTALAKLRDEHLPVDSEEKEHFFMSQVSLGEQLCAQGPTFYLPAAMSFYRALRVYPSPVELIVIYQKTIPEPVFKLFLELTNLDVKARVEGYYDVFPPKSMNVSVKPANAANAASHLRKVLVVERDFDAGEVIYKEQPVVAVLDADIQEKRTHCSHCLRHIQKNMAIRPDFDRLNSVYCSKDCQVKSKVQSQNLLFSLEPVLPAELDHGMAELTKDGRNKAQAAYVSYIKSQYKAAPLLVARFLARQVAIETVKLMPNRTGPLANELTEGSMPDGDYSLYDHLERLRFIDGKATEEETKILANVLAAALPGLEKSLTDERHATYLGKMAYNAIGVCYSGGRDDKPTPKERPEDQERTRTPYGTSRQVGCGLYPVSAYMAHSCAPSARPSFSAGTSELHLIATGPLKKGDELTMSYVDVSQHADETSQEARRRRRIELARGWKFKCECSRCMSETVDGNESDLGVDKDESKVEESVLRVEGGGGPAQTFLSPD
ncbi:hypothetical protein AcW1_004438 [Taiwanofungus camphoratus]|nr:hypothetical protein AcW2_006556 [Antrodia cinnamomea]KAI0952296.1 hypothetical protein AcV7_008154 [Antrodia cinnamomea]KAI0959678.1 hypothetical protein AcW1_004438 [Antrodia cinnamomea]